MASTTLDEARMGLCWTKLTKGRRMSLKLPSFKYHPDPLGTGSITLSDTECVCCGLARGYVYRGPVYAIEEYDERICPWCIADGSARDKLGASFNDEAGIGGYGKWDKVAREVMEVIAYRTPGFSGWQQPRWWTHCGDGAKFLGVAGRDELLDAGEQAIEAIRSDMEMGNEWEAIFERLSKDGSPTAYLFQCLKCGRLGGYWDCD